MAHAVARLEPSLPWTEYQEDKSFRWLSIIMLVLFLGAGLILNSIELPEIERKSLDDISPRLAKLILEKQKVKPPPKKKELVKEEIKKEKPKKKEKKKEKKLDDREVAKQSGLIALADELEDLRESFNLDDVLKQPQQNVGKQEVQVATASDLLSSTATQSSGGIKTDTLNRTITTNELTTRQTTKVESKIVTSETKLAKATTSNSNSSSTSTTKLKTRTEDEMARVFEQNKGGLFNLYQRALRKNPSLSGKVVIELTIAANGTVSAARILSSELGDEKLERKLLLKFKKFKFAKDNVAEIIVTYPIDFLPA